MTKKSRKSHWLLIVLSILILLGTIGATACLLFSNYQSVRLFKRAQSTFQRGDDKSLTAAETLLLQLIDKDSDNEAAYIMLGAIAEKRKVYPEQAYYCYMAHRLNPLSKENKELYVRSLWHARMFDRLENFLSQQSQLADEWKQFLVYSAGRNGNLEKYKHLLADSTEEHPACALALLLFRQNTLNIEEKLAALTKINGDGFMRQEILAAQAELYLALGDLDKSEAALKAAYELNPYAFAMPLGRFYANFRTLSLALGVFEKHLATYHDPVAALQTAEIYCLLGKTDEITALRNQYQSDSGSQAMLLCCYFDAMNAYMRNDIAAMKEQLAPLRKNLKTPLALFLFLCADTQDRNPASMLENYTALTASRGYMDLKSRADDMLSDFLKRALPEFTGREEQLLPLARRLYERKQEAFTAKVILLLQKRSAQSVNLLLLKDALQRFPQDQGIVKIAVEYYLQNDPAECERKIAHFKRTFPQKSGDMLQYELMLAARKKDFALASALFQKNFSPAILREYWNFATSTMREEDLRFLSRDKLYAPFCQAQLLLLKGSANAACDLLEQADAQGNQELLFFAAKTLAEHSRTGSALEKYGKFPEDSPYRLDVLLNTSELQAETGNIALAAELSRKAYQLAPDRPEAQFCHADKLYRSNNTAAIPDVVKLDAASPFRERMEFLWISGMEQRIKDCDLNNQQERARELCRQLLAVTPDNGIALECLKRLNSNRQ